MKKHLINITASTLLIALLASCAVGPDYQRPPTNAHTAWVAPLPHDGKPALLVNWWSQWDDTVLTELIDNAMRENTSVAQAAARIAQSRANYRSLTSLLFPAFTANASDIRSKGDGQGQTQSQPQGQPQGQQPTQSNGEQRIRNLSLDAAWELDVVGGARRGREAAAQRLNAREADWHDAKVMIAGEVAMQYVNLRACEILLQGFAIDTRSRLETARLTNLKKDAGFEAPANAALVSASASESNARLIAQRADCDVVVKTLVELTATSEPLLRASLEKKRAVLPIPKSFAINQIPADAISQRPDVASAERELAASMADIGLAIADRFPRISLTGVIGYQQFSSGGVESNGRTWRFGPAITLPIFDAGRRAANVDAARARYDEQLAAYKGKTLRAVREVEESLVRLDSAAKREADANAALNGYQQFLRAAEAKVKVGAGSLTELEDARRAVVAAQGTAVGVARERLTAWISLYKAVGGGWTSS